MNDIIILIVFQKYFPGIITVLSHSWKFKSTAVCLSSRNRGNILRYKNRNLSKRIMWIKQRRVKCIFVLAVNGCTTYTKQVFTYKNKPSLRFIFSIEIVCFSFWLPPRKIQFPQCRPWSETETSRMRAEFKNFCNTRTGTLCK